MAEIVIGIGSSHTPQMSTSAAYWREHAARDQRNARLLCADGEYRSYQEVLATAPASVLPELEPHVWDEKFARAQTAVEELARRLADAEPDVVIIVGDDQQELFRADGTPAIGLFTGNEVWDLPPTEEHLARIPADIQVANWAAHAETAEAYPVHGRLAGHLAEHLAAEDFDIMVMSEQPNARGVGHAFTFIRRRLHLAPTVPIVPVLLNTYFPPNVPSPARCYRLGQQLRAAVDTWSGSERVAFFASGGLSHFLVLEDLDRTVIEGLAAHDGDRLSAIPKRVMRSGTSETLNWLVVGGALEDAPFELVDYIPAYRSPAGTGVGMAFATWGPAGPAKEGPHP